MRGAIAPRDVEVDWMIRKIVAIALCVAVVLTAGWDVCDAQLTRDNRVRMPVEREDGNRFGITPDFTMYSRSDTLVLKLINGDSLAVKTDTLGIAGPIAWAILECEEEAYSTNLWFRCKELEDGKRVSSTGADTTQYYAWGAWACVILNGNAKDVPLNSIGLVDSIMFKCHGSANGLMIVNLRQELVAPTWRASDAAN